MLVRPRPLPSVPTCITWSKVFCFQSLSVSKNSFIRYDYQGGTCSGSPIQKYYAVLDICIPANNANTSVFFSFNESLNAVIQTQYFTHDCSGFNVKGTIQFGSFGVYYDTSPFSVPNLVGYYQYADTETCSGTPSSGTAYALYIYGHCHLGTSVTCNNNKLIVNQYMHNDCSGNITSALNLPVGACVNGKKSFCNGDFNVPAPYVSNINYDGFACGETITWIDFALIDVCVASATQSIMILYNSANNEVTVYQYDSPNCTIINVSKTSSQQYKLDSYTLGLSSSLLTATVSKYLMVFILVILNIYLW